MTRCEDYPCCGHTDGDGREPNERHTADYWRNRMASMTIEEIDYMNENDLWGE